MPAAEEPAENRLEQIYNLFVYVEGDAVAELGVVVHEAKGTDDEKAALLKSLVDSDHRTARRLRLVTPVERREFDFMMRVGTQIELFEDLFHGTEALWMITAIVDGTPRVLRPGEPLDDDLGIVDYLERYVVNGKFDVHQLINDDHFVPIKLLFNAQHYISAAKLLMSSLDSIAFIGLGDVPGCFCSWLDTYVDLTPLDITSRELWEFRNGLLHMSNMASRAVLRGDVARLVMCIGNIPESSRGNTPDQKYFNLKRLIDQIAEGLGRWVAVIFGDRVKLLDFVDRYDLTVSDARLIRKARG